MLIALTPALQGPIRTELRVEGDLYSRFMSHALSNPHQIAIYRDDDVITYAEVFALVLELSDRLRALGVQGQDRVAIQIARSPSFVISVFAVLAVGAVFVPLSEDEPPFRAETVCANVGAAALLRMSEDSKHVVVENHHHKLERLFPESSEEIAYILHTSGSTGTPKGVAISKASLRNCLGWHADKFEIGRMSRVSHLNLTSFDFIIAEVLLPLSVGGSMVIPSASVSSDVVGVIEALSKADVSIIQLVPTLLGRFLRALSAVQEMRKSLHAFQMAGHMICNGEALSDSMRRTFYRLFPRSSLHNCYGPTEACVAVTEYLCPKDDLPLKMYIGTPVPNVNLYICDIELRDVPRGEIGELLIGGAQTGMGYVGDAAETSSRFLEIATNGGRSIVYRTGDLVRLSQGGFLEFMGRDDNQVKFRGLRVELGEIEAAVQSSGLCNEAKAIVTNPGESDGRQELIVFVAPLIAPIQILMDHLAAKLPMDRQPTQIVPVKTLPVTDRGKLDLKQLIFLAREKRTSDVWRREENHTKDLRGASENNVENLLQGIFEITKREYLAEDLWPVARMDSLAFMDLGLWLLEKGLRFKSHAYQIYGIPLRRLADDLEPVSGSASDANLHAAPQIAPKDPQEDT